MKKKTQRERHRSEQFVCISTLKNDDNYYDSIIYFKPWSTNKKCIIIILPSKAFRSHYMCFTVLLLRRRRRLENLSFIDKIINPFSHSCRTRLVKWESFTKYDFITQIEKDIDI